jgi:hypothetical protein
MKFLDSNEDASITAPLKFKEKLCVVFENRLNEHVIEIYELAAAKRGTQNNLRKPQSDHRDDCVR